MVFKNLKKRKLLTLVVLISIISFAITIFADNDYIIMSFLPLSFGFVNILFFTLYGKIRNSLVAMITVVGYTIKMSIVPAVVVLGNYNVLILTDGILKNLNYAVLLSIYEVVAIYLYLYYYLFHKCPKQNSAEIQQEQKKYNIFFIAKNNYLIFLGLMFIAAVILARYNVLINYFKFFWETDASKVIAANSRFSTMKPQVPALLYWLYIYIVELIRILIIGFSAIPALKKKSKIGILRTIVLIIVLISYSTPENAMVWFALAAFGVLVLSQQEKLQKYIIEIGTILFLIVVLGLTIKLGSNDNNIFEVLSMALAAYFPATINLSYAFEIVPNPVYLITDTLSTLPFIEYFFKGLDTGLRRMASVVMSYGYLGNDQLTPTISQGTYYFSWALAPLLTILSLKIATTFELKMIKANDYFTQYLLTFITIITSISFIMYNFSTLTKLLTYYGPLFGVMIMINKKYIKRTTR